MTKKELEHWYESLKAKQEETLEPVPALEPDEDDPNNSVFEGLDLNDPYFVELYSAQNPEISEYVNMLNQLNVFKEEEEYNLVKDLQDGFNKSLSKPLYDRLFEKLPEHVFWDIKTPLHKTMPKVLGKYNQMKPYQHNSFLDFKYDDEYFYRRSKNPNTDQHRRINRHY